MSAFVTAVPFIRRGFTLREKLALVGEIVYTYVRVRWLLSRTDLPLTLAALRESGATGEVEGAEARLLVGRRLARAVTRTLPLLPAESRCLMRSLVLLGLLARRRIETILVIGIKQGPDFAAHAWVELSGRPLLVADEETFSRVADL